MKALIIVESMFGNTRSIADRVAESLSETMHVDVRDVDEAPHDVPDDVTLLVLAGPTHAFSLSRGSTRAEAVTRGAPRAPEHGLRDWLDGRPRLPDSTWVATFDTRIAKPLVPGSAAKGAVRKLRRLGAHLLVEPTSFYVIDVDGPLRPGETSRIDAWIDGLRLALRRHGQPVTGAR
jgi:hypothetical protein